MIIRNVGMGRQRGTGFRPSSWKIVEHAGRQPGIGEALDDHRNRQRRLMRRLDDHRTACRQRWPDFPRVNIDRIIPRRDRADDADRRGDDEAADVAPRRRPQRAADAPSLLRVIANDFDAKTDFLDRIGHRFALFARQEIGDRGDALVDQIGCALQHDRGSARLR